MSITPYHRPAESVLPASVFVCIQPTLQRNSDHAGADFPTDELIQPGPAFDCDMSDFLLCQLTSLGQNPIRLVSLLSSLSTHLSSSAVTVKCNCDHCALDGGYSVGGFHHYNARSWIVGLCHLEEDRWHEEQYLALFESHSLGYAQCMPSPGRHSTCDDRF
jgi:hypothetical protein